MGAMDDVTVEPGPHINVYLSNNVDDDGKSGLGNDDHFILTVIIFAVVLHVFLIIVVCYCVCCRKERPIEVLDIGIGRRMSVGERHAYSRRQIDRTSSYRRQNSRSLVEGGQPSSLESATTGGETAQGTHRHRSIVSRMRAQFGLAPRAVARQQDSPPPVAPPPYGADGDVSDMIGGLENPGAVLGEGGNDLPTYDDYLQDLPVYYREYGEDYEVELPPAYDDVVKKPSD